MKFSKGDIVQVIPDLKKYSNKQTPLGLYINEKMINYAGRTFTIQDYNSFINDNGVTTTTYLLNTDDCEEWMWDDCCVTAVKVSNWKEKLEESK
jgi:hypothetical protein